MAKLRARPTQPRPDDPVIIEHFSNAIRKGHPISTAAELAGIGDTTARRYIEYGEREAEAGEVGSYRAFWEAFKAAEAEMVDEQLDRVHRDASQKGGWPAAMTLLERRRPKDFGRNQQIQIESNTTITYVHELGPGAETAILARREELESLRASSETTTEGPTDTPTPLLSQHTDRAD